jgi:hypothetical protein
METYQAHFISLCIPVNSQGFRRARTVHLTQGKTDDICNEIRKVLKEKRVAIKRFRSLIGVCRHAAACLPSIRGLFSPLNKALHGDPIFVGLGRDSESRAALIGMRILILDLADRPTHVLELVPGDDLYVGYCDACATGAGGVWFSDSLHTSPLVWRVSQVTSRNKSCLSRTQPGNSPIRIWS